MASDKPYPRVRLAEQTFYEDAHAAEQGLRVKLLGIIAFSFAFMSMAVCVSAEEDSVIDVTKLADQLYKLTIDAVSYTVNVETLQEEGALSEWASYGEGYNSANYWIMQIAKDLQNIRPKKSIFEPVYYTLKEKGVDALIEHYYDLKNNHFDEYVFSDTRLYFLAYKLLLEKGRFQDAIKVLRVNIEEYPASEFIWATYDALGEAYMKMGDKEPAIENYKKSLELYPDNTQAVEALKKLEGNEAAE